MGGGGGLSDGGGGGLSNGGGGGLSNGGGGGLSNGGGGGLSNGGGADGGGGGLSNGGGGGGISPLSGSVIPPKCRDLRLYPNAVVASSSSIRSSGEASSIAFAITLRPAILLARFRVKETRRGVGKARRVSDETTNESDSRSARWADSMWRRLRRIITPKERRLSCPRKRVPDPPAGGRRLSQRACSQQARTRHSQKAPRRRKSLLFSCI